MTLRPICTLSGWLAGKNIAGFLSTTGKYAGTKACNVKELANNGPYSVLIFLGSFSLLDLIIVIYGIEVPMTLLISGVGVGEGPLL